MMMIMLAGLGGGIGAGGDVGDVCVQCKEKEFNVSVWKNVKLF